ncbi:trypsin-like peptidase domain-containing protein [Streptomyces sp. NPDC005899]|uniref:trypsin-like peptidase domain-containing protein n=1 Tax=Streptomyces sp. NPDC005899 TaxID=3155716 RepID=UPI0033CF8C6C
MDDGKPSGPKAKWWSRPSAGRTGGAERDSTGPAGYEDTPVGDVAAGETPAATAGIPAPPAGSAAEPAAPPAVGIPSPASGSVPAPSVTEVPAQPSREPIASPRQARGAASVPYPAAPPPTAGDALTPGLPEHGPRVPAFGRQPLHAPDEYSTPPYGGPGPWAPAPPVQRPVPTPAHGTPVPPAHPGPLVPESTVRGPAEGYAPPVPPQTTHDQPQPQPQPQQHQPRPQPPAGGYEPPAGPPHAASQWGRYDPWGGSQQPLHHSGPPPGTDTRPRRGRPGSVVAGALLLALVAGGIGGGIGSYVERNGGLTTVELPQAGRDNGDRAPDSVAGIASSALPSVVTLHVSGSAESGTGTGFVLDGKGHILTNNHVVAPAGSSGDITVTFSGGETASAEIVGKDSGYDLAVVKVKGVSGLRPLPLGNSDNVRVGDPVVAIGAPFDLSNTVTSGIISAKQRPITAGGDKGDGTDVSYVDALQTDAPINPGNSGGPLVDADARVIGINSAIRAADSGAGPDGGQSGSIGLGFAIPINQGKRVAEELINTGRATHPVIGVTLDMDFTGDGAKVGGKAGGGGPAVTEGGAADKAGVEAGDVITEVEGRRVHSGEELIVKIRAHRPGDRLALRLTRDGEELSVTLTLGSASGT